jgi:hypothetical protein
MKRFYYSDKIEDFCKAERETILGHLSIESQHAIESPQMKAWVYQIELLQETLKCRSGHIYFEYSIPRMGKRIDVLLLIEHVVFVLEFKVGESEFIRSSIKQVIM